MIAEYLTGVELTNDEDRRTSQRAVLAAALDVASVLDYTREIAEHHAVLMANARRLGTPRGHHDMIIAATARATDRTILTRDVSARFDELPGVSARVITRDPPG